MAEANRPPFDAGFGVYIHWPFCQAKCPYCDFNSHVRHHRIDEAAYVAAFRVTLAQQAEMAPDRLVSSIFFGGGTPSLMSPATVSALIEAVAANWRLAPDAEITLEANPTSVEAERFRGYRAAGVNRVSLGVQSLNAADLAALGRLHTVEEALRAVALAREIFPRLSFDLIYARPGQTPEAWARELAEAIGYAADHLSLYQLTIEPGTPFETLHRAGKLKTPSPELGRAFYDATNETCAAAGLPAYEVSNYARPGAECRHNLVYWRYGEYAGVGPGAHGRLVAPQGRLALASEKSPEAWLASVGRDGHGHETTELLSAEEQGDEFLLMGLRLVEGIDPERFTALSGRKLDSARIAELTRANFISLNSAGRLAVTAIGFPILDAVVADLAA